MSDQPIEVVPDQLEVDEALEIVVRDERRQPARRAAAQGELVAPAAELVEAFGTTFVSSPQTRRTYERACLRFVAWLDPLAEPADITRQAIAKYHEHLVAGGRSTATVKKDRAAINTFVRWLADEGALDIDTVRAILGVRLPRAAVDEDTRDAPKALSAEQYERLLREAKARIVDDPVAGARDYAIVIVLGDAGLRCEELAELQRRDFLPARTGAKLRALDVRHGKGDRRRRVKLSRRAAAAIVRWDRERAAALGPTDAFDGLFVTLGTRRRDGTYNRAGGRCGQAVLADVVARLGTAAELPDELRHPHALRHTCATELLRAGASLPDVRAFLGHASVKTTSIYLATSEERQEAIVAQRERPDAPVLDADRHAA